MDSRFVLILLVWLLWDHAVARAATVPPDWVPRIAAADMMYAPTDVGVKYMPLIGNGYVGTTVGGTDTYMAGVFNGFANVSPSHRARLQSNLAITVTNANVTACALDVRRATYYRRSAADGATVEQRWYAHRVNRSLLVMELQVVLNAGVTSAVLQLATNAGPSTSDFTFTTVTSDPTYRVINGSTVLAEEAGSPRHIVSVASTVVPKSIRVTASSTLYFVAAFRSSLDTLRPATVAAVTADYQWAMAHAGSLHASHTAGWASLWESGYEIEGRFDVARAVNTSMYSMLSAIRADFDFSLSPGGLTDGYNGHTFWDCETWMYPNFALLHQDIAAGLIRYRFNRVSGAEIFAKTYKPPYSGTQFPWESGFTGQNVCPKGVGTCTREIHISGDIAFALRQYWRLTRNMTWLKATAHPITTGIAEFWVSRAVVNATGQASIDDVIGPDEYHDHVNNSVYTNSVAKISLDFASQVATLLGLTPPPEWQQLSDALVILFNGTIHPEYAGYNGETIKQADVILLGFPLDIDFGHMSPAVRKADLDYYGSVTSPGGPAMTWGMQAIGYIGTGDLDLAYSNFNRSFANVQEPFLVWAETPSGGTTNFITGAGGFVQTVLFGWPQLRIRDSGLQLNPLLAQGATRAKLRGVDFLGAVLDVEYDDRTMTFNITSPGDALTLTTATGGVKQLLRSATPFTLPVQQVTLSA